MDLLHPDRIEPDRQYPRTRASGSFTKGTYPHARPYSSGVLACTNRLCPPPSPAHSTADRSVTWLSPRLRYYAVVRRLAQRRFPLRRWLIGSLLPVLPENRTSPPGVTSWSSVPCRPQTPWYGGWMRNAFASIVQARPCPTFGRPVRHGVAPIDYGPVLLLMPFGFRLAADTLPSGLRAVAPGSPWRFPAFAFVPV